MKKLEDNILKLANKDILVRVNFDVPLENGKILDTTRIEDSIVTLQLLLKHKCRLLLLTHAGRPEGKYQKEYTLAPIVPLMEELLHQKIDFLEYTADINKISVGKNPVSLLENIRFWPQEEENEPQFGKTLASFGDFYINEAFANCHRKHASIVGIPTYLESFAGVSLSREIEVLSMAKYHPKKPLVVIIGGAKLETKEPLVTAFADEADYILVGGKIAQDLGDKHIALPDNVVLANLVKNGKDITVKSAQHFREIISEANTIIWNGTMGIFEEEEYQKGTLMVAQAINETSGFTIAGGGDTEAALTKMGLENKIDYVSTGGGAMLTYLSTGSLPGIEVL